MTSITVNNFEFIITNDDNNNIINIDAPKEKNNDVLYNHLMHFVNENINNLINLSNDNFIKFIENLNIYNYCVVCKCSLEFNSESLITCDNDDCCYKYEELVIGNHVCDTYKDDPEIALLLIQSAYKSINSKRCNDIFEPFPKYFLKSNVDLGIKRGTLSKMTGQNYNNLKDFTSLKSAIIDNIEEILANIHTDEELVEKIGKKSYILLRFILLSNKVMIQRQNILFNVDAASYLIYKITYSNEIENEFNKYKGDTSSNFLYHGSKHENWYSILRNGLKICSGTGLMTTGAVYGNGAYFSNDLNVSASYGSNGDNLTIGIYEIIDIPKWKQTENIFVCNDEKSLIQRYLLIIPHKRYKGSYDEINKLFIKEAKRDEIILKENSKNKSVMKILREYKAIVKTKPDNFKIEIPNRQNIFEWKIFMFNFNKDSHVAKDMLKYNIESIEGEIIFEKDYPFSPPFIRIIKPKFQYLTGHITSEGALCNEILTRKNWTSTCTIESLVNMIMLEISEGGGRIDGNRLNETYNYDKAVESFNRVSKSHGWI